MVNDMSVGSPQRILWKFALPMVGSVIFQQLYNIADSVIAGKCIGDQALAAVGASYPITMIFMAFALGSSAGCAVVISQHFGGKRYEQMKTAVWTALIASVVLSFVLSAIGLLGCNPLLSLLNTPENIFQDSGTYLLIYSAGLLFMFLYNICTGAFTALGDSMTPLWLLIASSLGNIVLDLVFVQCFHMGVAGVAWATFLCQGVAGALSLILLLRRLAKVPSGPYKRFSRPMLGEISRLAVPSILQHSFVSVGNLLIQAVVNGYGSDVIAGYSAAIKLNTFSITLMNTLSNSASSFTAQNLGAGKPGRVQEGFRAALKISTVISLGFSLLYVFASPLCMKLFVDNASTDVIQVGARFLRIVAPFYVMISLKIICDGVLRGAAAVRCFMISTFSDLVLRVVLAAVFSGFFHTPSAIWIAWPVGWGIATVLSYYFYKRDYWRQPV